MAAKTKSYGTVLSYSAAGSVYTALTDLTSIGGLNIECADIDVSYLESSSSAREYLAGWKEGGVVEFVGYYTKSQFNTLIGLIGGSSDSYYWKITFPLLSGESGAGTVIFRGHLKKIGLDTIDFAPDGRIMAQFSIKVSGLPAHTSAT